MYFLVDSAQWGETLTSKGHIQPFKVLSSEN